MADNLDITQGTGTTIGADEISSVKYQRIKLIHGVDGTNDGDVATGNPLPVVQTGAPTIPTGAATSAKQDTGNTSLSSIDGKITVVNTGAVTVAASALPSGAATAAKQPALGTAGTASADVITVQGKAAMTPLLVDNSANTQPVSNGGLTELAAAINSSKVDVNIVSSDVASGGTASADGTGFVVDTTLGTPAMGVYEASPTTLTDGDLGVPGLTSGRRLKTSTTVDAALPAGNNNIGDVDIASSALPTGASTSALQSTGNTSLGTIDTSTAAAASGMGATGDAAATAGSTGSLSAKQRLMTSQLDSIKTAVETIDNIVSGAGANLTQIGGTNIDTNSGTKSAGTQRVVIATDQVQLTNALKVDPSAVTSPVSLASVPSHAVTNAGTFAVQSATSGDVAHDGVDSGNPSKVGGQARITNPTAVADADRSNFITDKLGKQVVVGSIRDLKGVQQTTITSSTSETTIVTAVASTFLDLYALIITNTSGTVTKVTIKDDTAGTTRAVIEVPATETRGFTLNESAAIPQAVVNKPWTATCGTSVAAIEITALYVKNT